ncbi:hypothetical protein [Paenibacillus sp. EPM92]|uniref:hypothetical protein n=1 Tax=Paenibacillus sp. EPM92 TaxID=1561195 RepID=UPI0019158291|nr:hypothetical protein [Paenibacillus sp. EPM92]
MNKPYMETLIGALRHEVKEGLDSDVSSEAINDLLSDLVANAIILDKENLEMVYVLMLVLNSFLKEKRGIK